MAGYRLASFECNGEDLL
ncbi:hypothetical protein A2U01_0099799 [Trifolium medium]|uniref:Uncharacterized protein n=1 Tax=Trifolium medium TaxID=97028 RepID=A0A392UU56_9FABA|nr:hypothetical protein [Trifolium medium]